MYGLISIGKSVLGYDTESSPRELTWTTLKIEVGSSSGKLVMNYSPTMYFMAEDFKLYRGDYEILISCKTVITEMCFYYCMCM
jgi:hypothetical protein